ncbi:hypothetical protein Q763_11255 [Flavobacterium beibuense F44-8]|uniref:Lipoprotein n=1 Tax=Flavobacterium beibuense F44-8 TaxID=1406840 RepID=A0A0A2LK12_9FLAO|nr:hypothetical protein [Flavobacterium beibuense]KGO80229.1 hypothetical protein Q763_11255 [Flavobacterium beibuense F44-8]
MKFLKTTCLVAFALIMGGNLLVSCSADNETDNNAVSGINTTSFLKSTTVDEYYLTEVFLGENNRPLGYMVSLTASDDALYFMNIEETTFEVTTFDEERQSVRRFADLEGFNKYYDGDDFDPIRVIEEPGFEEPDPGQPVTMGSRYSYGSPVYGPDGCTQGVYQTPYFLGIKLGKTRPTMIVNDNGNYVQAQVPCGETYNP